MARNVATVSLNSASASGPIEIYLPRNGNSWVGAGLLVTFPAGASATATVDVSGDGANWNPHDTLFNLTASANGNLTFPVLFVRLRLSAWISGTVILNVIQTPGV